MQSEAVVLHCLECGTPMQQLLTVPAKAGLSEVAFLRCSVCRTMTMSRRRFPDKGTTDTSEIAD